MNLRFTRCYIRGTLVITEAKNITFDKAVVHAPAEAYYPALVFDTNSGTAECFYQLDENLSEVASNVDFNGDGDKTDKFTSSVSGVVFGGRRISGFQAIGGTNIVRFKGALVSQIVRLIGSGCIFEQDPSLATNLVNGFQGIGLKLVKGSIKVK